MGGLMPKAPKAPKVSKGDKKTAKEAAKSAAAPVVVQAPDVPEPDPIIGPEDLSTTEAVRRARMAMLRNRGRASTILTGPTGLGGGISPALTYTNTILGS